MADGLSPCEKRLGETSAVTSFLSALSELKLIVDCVNDLLLTPTTSDESRDDDDVVPDTSHIVPSQSNTKKFHYGMGENSVLTVDNDIHNCMILSTL